MIFFGIKNRWTHLRKKHDKEKDLRNEAFLSKIQLGEKIIPCIIIVIYYEEHFWKGNKDLYDLFINTNEHVNNYSMRQVELCKDSTNYDNDEEFLADISAVNGNSGSPVFTIYNNQIYFVGINYQSFDYIKKSNNTSILLPTGITRIIKASVLLEMVSKPDF